MRLLILWAFLCPFVFSLNVMAQQYTTPTQLLAAVEAALQKDSITKSEYDGYRANALALRRNPEYRRNDELEKAKRLISQLRSKIRAAGAEATPTPTTAPSTASPGTAATSSWTPVGMPLRVMNPENKLDQIASYISDSLTAMGLEIDTVQMVPERSGFRIKATNGLKIQGRFKGYAEIELVQNEAGTRALRIFHGERVVLREHSASKPDGTNSFRNTQVLVQTANGYDHLRHTWDGLENGRLVSDKAAASGNELQVKHRVVDRLVNDVLYLLRDPEQVNLAFVSHDSLFAGFPTSEAIE